MGSGGGYRAACGLSGVFVALQEEGILDYSSYVTGLSGSSWYAKESNYSYVYGNGYIIESVQML